MPDYYSLYGYMYPDMQGMDLYLQSVLNCCKSEEEKDKVRAMFAIGGILCIVGSIALMLIAFAVYKFLF